MAIGSSMTVHSAAGIFILRHIASILIFHIPSHAPKGKKNIALIVGMDGQNGDTYIITSNASESHLHFLTNRYHNGANSESIIRSRIKYSGKSAGPPQNQYDIPESKSQRASSLTYSPAFVNAQSLSKVNRTNRMLSQK